MRNQNEQVYKLPVTIMRGGTSKGIYILQSDLPENREEWDAILLRLMGSPDSKQIDGLGGSQSVTSKVAIVGKSQRVDADVDYTFAQVSVDKPIVSYKGNCGNISSGVGPFALEKGLVTPNENETTVRIYNTNTGKIIAADVKTSGNHVNYTGDFQIAGVPGTASPIRLKFLNPAGTLGKGLLPTGNAVDVLTVPDFGEVKVSIVDAANPLVFVNAKDLGLTGKENPNELNADAAKLELLETVRGLAAVKLGLIDDYKKSPELYQQNMPWYLDQISNCTYRQFTTGFFYGKPSDEAQIYDNNTYLKEYTYLGIVGETNEEGLYRIEQRNKFSVGEQIEVMKPDGENIEVTVKRIVDEEGNEMESAPHPKQVLYIDLGHPLEMYDILRRKE